MLGIVGFINEHIRYRRHEDQDIEEIWDQMINGHARDVHKVSGKEKFLNFVLNVVGIVLSFIGLYLILKSGFKSSGNVSQDNILFLCFFAAIVVFPIMINTILRCVVKRIWLRILLSIVICFVLGLLLGVIGLAF